MNRIDRFLSSNAFFRALLVVALGATLTGVAVLVVALNRGGCG